MGCSFAMLHALTNTSSWLTVGWCFRSHRLVPFSKVPFTAQIGFGPATHQLFALSGFPWTKCLFALCWCCSLLRHPTRKRMGRKTSAALPPLLPSTGRQRAHLTRQPIQNDSLGQTCHKRPLQSRDVRGNSLNSTPVKWLSINNISFFSMSQWSHWITRNCKQAHGLHDQPFWPTKTSLMGHRHAILIVQLHKNSRPFCLPLLATISRFPQISVISIQSASSHTIPSASANRHINISSPIG